MKSITKHLLGVGVLCLGLLCVPASAAPTIGQWDFDNSNLVATAGSSLGDLQFADNTTSNLTAFGTTTAFGIPGIGGSNASVMHFPAATNGGGYLMPVPATPNGGPGATKVNNWTFIMDLLYPPPSDFHFRPLIDTDGSAFPGPEFIISDTTDGVGITPAGPYQGFIAPQIWYRLAVVVTPAEVDFYIDGLLVSSNSGGGLDGRFALPPGTNVLILGTTLNQAAEGYVNSVQLRDVPLTPAQIAGLGHASADGIPFPQQVVVFSMNSISNNIIGLCFDQPITMASASDPSHYVVNGGTIVVQNVIVHADLLSVELRLTTPIGEFFSVCVSNVLDSAGHLFLGNRNGFISEYSTAIVGVAADPAGPGNLYTCFWDTFNVSVGGSGFGTAGDPLDHCRFIYDTYIGDFDMRVLVSRLDFVNPFSQAGLMARESVAPEGASVETYVTSGPAGLQILLSVRDFQGNPNIQLANFPLPPGAALPWLRLTRTNNSFTAYYATNGEDWVVTGTASGVVFKPELLLGPAVSSHDNTTNTIATVTSLDVKGTRPGDDIVPPLQISLNGSNAVITYPRTPRSYAVQVTTNITVEPEWGLLMTPYQLISNNMVRLSVPVGLLGKQLFIRPLRVDKLIPDIASIMVDTGIILSPGSGLTSTASGSTLCSSTIIGGTAFAQTGSYIVFSNPTSVTASIDTLQSSSSVNTLLQSRNYTLFTTLCSDDMSVSVKTSKTGLPGASPSYTRYTFVTAAKSGSSPTSTIKVWCNY